MSSSVYPAELKNLLPYYKISLEFGKRDPVVAYYCRLYLVQNGIKQNAKSIEVKKFLMTVMDEMEKAKVVGNEAIINEVVGQAHVENIAMRLFLHADTEDRASNFNKNLVKTFYTSFLLFEILTVFGEQTDEVKRNQKYSKWKAAYISKCLKSGEMPIPGPVEGSEDAMFGELGEGNEFSFQPGVASGGNFRDTSASSALNFDETNVPSQSHQSYGMNVPASSNYNSAPTGSGDANTSSLTLSPENSDKAQKYCRYAISALQYDDVTTAVDNLQKALQLLQIGR